MVGVSEMPEIVHRARAFAKELLPFCKEHETEAPPPDKEELGTLAHTAVLGNSPWVFPEDGIKKDVDGFEKGAANGYRDVPQ